MLTLHDKSDINLWVHTLCNHHRSIGLAVPPISNKMQPITVVARNVFPILMLLNWLPEFSAFYWIPVIYSAGTYRTVFARRLAVGGFVRDVVANTTDDH